MFGTVHAKKQEQIFVGQSLNPMIRERQPFTGGPHGIGQRDREVFGRDIPLNLHAESMCGMKIAAFVVPPPVKGLLRWSQRLLRQVNVNMRITGGWIVLAVDGRML